MISEDLRWQDVSVYLLLALLSDEASFSLTKYVSNRLLAGPTGVKIVEIGLSFGFGGTSIVL